VPKEYTEILVKYCFEPTAILNQAYCKFLCSGGCAISLATYAYDAFGETKEIREKLDSIISKLNNIDYEIGKLENRLSR